MADHSHDVRILRDLVKQYVEVAAKPVQDERRKLWSAHNALQPTRPPVMATFGMWNVWCREVFGDHALQCQDEFFRGHERTLRMKLFGDSIGDDWIQEPWLTQGAVHILHPKGLWGLEEKHIAPDVAGGSWQFDPPLASWDDVQKLVTPTHAIDEQATAQYVQRLRDAVGDLIEINVARGSSYMGFNMDISTRLARLRGLEQMMVDMLESPEELHRLLAFMRDGILKAQREAEEAGDLSINCGQNQSLTYTQGLAAPRANAAPCKRSEMWGFAAAQEFTAISPAMHDEFLLQYQLPIMSKFKLMAYGCCEDYTRKIGMLRQVPNLRQIAVTPVADVASCAEQIGSDYIVSWRPNPTNMVCCGFDETKIRRIISHGLRACRANNCRVHVHLKDIETVEGEPGRLAKWVRIVREEAAQMY